MIALWTYRPVLHWQNSATIWTRIVFVLFINMTIHKGSWVNYKVAIDETGDSNGSWIIKPVTIAK